MNREDQRRGLLAAVLACTVCGLSTAVASAEPPPREADAEDPLAPEPTCVQDAASARAGVEDAFAELQRIHRGRVPGPAGAKLLETRVIALIDRLVAFDVFIGAALGDAWDKADDEQKKAWHEILEETLRRRYLQKLGSPLASRIDIKGVALRCDRAEVVMAIVDRQGQHPRDVVLQLVTSGPESWSAYDVAVDGVSLLETWKSRFRRIYADDGVFGIDQHMRGLRERYPPKR